MVAPQPCKDEGFGGARAFETVFWSGLEDVHPPPYLALLVHGASGSLAPKKYSRFAIRRSLPESKPSVPC